MTIFTPSVGRRKSATCESASLSAISVIGTSIRPSSNSASVSACLKIDRTSWLLGGLSKDRIMSQSTHAPSHDRARKSTALNERVNPRVSVLIPNARAVAMSEFISTPEFIKTDAIREEVAANSERTNITSPAGLSSLVWWSITM